MTEAEGSCSRAQFHALLQQHHGRVIGYKAALTNPAIQRMLKANGPIWGRLYAGMLLPDGAVVDAGFGPRPTVEADLLGHPLDAALWLVGALAAEGISLQPGDLLSVGSFPPVLQARAGMAVTVTYAGLPGAAPVSVSLR